MTSICRKTGLIGSLFFCLLLNSSIAHGGWFARPVSAASAAAKDAGKVVRGGSFADIADAVRFVKNLPRGNSGHALAASVSDEGHWHLMNASGERATVSGPTELNQALKWLMQERFHQEPRLITFYISDVSLIKNPKYLDVLPAGAGLRIVSGRNDYRIIRKGIGEQNLYSAQLRDYVDVALDDVEQFREALWQIERPFDKARLRFLSLVRGEAKTVPSVPVVGSDGMPKLDIVDPYFLDTALRPLFGQSVVVTGNVVGDLLYFEKSGDAGLSILVSDIKRAAREFDMDLVILNTGEARQPGRRDWLWRKTGVAGLAAAFQANTMGDFLNVLGAGRDGFDLSIEHSNRSRVSLKVKARVRPRGLLETGKNTSGGDGIGSVLTDVMASIKGDVVVSSIALDLRSSNRQKELDRRLISGVPSAIQYGYLVILGFGLLGLPAALLWWRQIWPPEKQAEYRTRAALWSAMAVRWALFGAIFLPLVALPAFSVQLGNFIRTVVSGPYKWFARRSVE